EAHPAQAALAGLALGEAHHGAADTLALRVGVHREIEHAEPGLVGARPHLLAPEAERPGRQRDHRDHARAVGADEPALLDQLRIRLGEALAGAPRRCPLAPVAGPEPRGQRRRGRIDHADHRADVVDVGGPHLDRARPLHGVHRWWRTPSVKPRVSAWPPRSRVRVEASPSAATMARCMRSAAWVWPMCSSSITADSMSPAGVAMPLPAMSGAVP